MRLHKLRSNTTAPLCSVHISKQPTPSMIMVEFYHPTVFHLYPVLPIALLSFYVRGFYLRHMEVTGVSAPNRPTFTGSSDVTAFETCFLAYRLRTTTALPSCKHFIFVCKPAERPLKSLHSSVFPYALKELENE